jgi:hypothetical protein
VVLQSCRCGPDSRDLLAQAIEGVPKLDEGLNPATWMLQISTPGMEANLGTDFNKEYRESKLHQCVCCPVCFADSCIGC